MAVVYLPYGYPIQSGTDYENLIYQGVVVRVYDVPLDPRTNEQLFHRRFLSDTSKVRSMMSTWGKAAAKTVFGSKWATVVYQLIKADEGARWSEAESAWNTFTISERNAWNAVAPYLATFNDPGKVFYCYARALAALLFDFSGITWLASVWTSSDSAAAAAWWAKVDSSELATGIVDDTNAHIVYGGSWHTNGWAGAFGGAVHETLVAGAGSAEFYFLGSSLSFQYVKHTVYGTVRIFLDEVDQGTLSQYNAGLLTGISAIYYPAVKGLHYMRVVADAGIINLDALQVA